MYEHHTILNEKLTHTLVSHAHQFYQFRKGKNALQSKHATYSQKASVQPAILAFMRYALSLFFVFCLLPHNSLASSSTLEGAASWYGKDFAGNLTANGEIFNPQELTAAHRTLPFDTRVKVINLENDAYVIVRINDRGPYVHGRIIDLSRAAAAEINMVNAGVARVQLEILDDLDGLEESDMLKLSEVVPEETVAEETVAEIEAVAHEVGDSELAYIAPSSEALSTPDIAEIEAQPLELHYITPLDTVDTVDTVAISQPIPEPEIVVAIADLPTEAPASAATTLSPAPLSPAPASLASDLKSLDTLLTLEPSVVQSAQVLRPVDSLMDGEATIAAAYQLQPVHQLEFSPAADVAGLPQRVPVQAVPWLEPLQVACPDYPTGTKLKVTNPQHDSVFVVTVLQQEFSDASVVMLASEYLLTKLGAEMVILN